MVAVPAILTAAHVDAPFVLGGSVAAAAVCALFAGFWRDDLVDLLKRDRTEELAVRNGCLRTGKGMPLVRHVTDPTLLGVHRARRIVTSDGRQSDQPPYVPRDIDTHLRELLARPGFILIVGDSTAGKSRTAFEAIAAALPDHLLFAVQERRVLEHAVSRMTDLSRCVLFLDDLEKFLGDGGLTYSMIGQLLNDAGRERFVVATIRLVELANYEETDPGVRTVSGEALATIAAATRIPLARMFSDTEESRARTRAHTDVRLADAVEHVASFGIAEYLAAGPELMQKWQGSREGGDHVRGASLVSAAVECRRAGMIQPLARTFLVELSKSMLPTRGGIRVAGESLDCAWTWATVAQATTALLRPADDSEDAPVIVFDYVVDEVTRAAEKPVSDTVLRACLDTADSAEAMRIGATARLHASYLIALEAFDKAREAYAAEMGTDSEAALAAWGHHAATLRAMGRFAEAETEHAAVLAARLRTLGPDNSATLASRNNLALLLHELGRLGEAEAEHRIVHEVRARLLGADHPATLTNRNNLALVLHDLGRFAEAEAEHCAVLRTYDRVLGEAIAGRGDHTINIAAVLASLGRLEDAETEHRAVLDTSTRVYGPDHPDALTSNGSPTLVLHAHERLGEAVELHQSVFDRYREVLGSDHPTTLTALSNLAVVLHARGKVDQAEAAHRASVEGFGRILGENHPSTLTCKSNHAVVLQALGQVREAENEHRSVVTGFEQTLGSAHPSTLTSRNYLASMLFSLGRFQQAESEQEQVLAGFIATFGPDHPSTLTSRGNLAVTRAALGRREEALIQQQVVAAGFTRLRGPEHPSTLTARSNVAVALYAVGRRNEAIVEGRAVLEGFTCLLGPDHPTTVRARRILESLEVPR
ncbi:tetratricopeptide repeat protein [Nocardia sp. NPDC020380]|uniref:tetratricopeptide repeat protein n=1 Tax=Nocardia sp. NPDC020380 TaxID=3364309 RepID=UPI0037AAB592